MQTTRLATRCLFPILSYCALLPVVAAGCDVVPFILAPDGVEKIVLIGDWNAKQAELTCPQAIGDDPDACPFRTLAIQADGVWVWLRLDSPPDVTDAYVRLSFPEYLLFRPFAAEAAYDSSINLGECVGVLHEFSESHARGTITGTIERIDIRYERPNDPNCVSGDIAGQCWESVRREVPFRVEFDLSLDQ